MNRQNYKGSPLAPIILALKEYKSYIEKNIQGFPKFIQKFLISVKTHPQNHKLTNHFEQLETHDQFYEIIEAIGEHLTPLQTLWEPFKQEYIHNYIQNSQEIIPTAQATMELLAKFIKATDRRNEDETKVIKLLDGVKSALDTRYFVDMNIAMLMEAAEIPMRVNLEMDLYFSILRALGVSAKNFQTSLFQKDSKQPCSSFTAFDLFFDQIFRFLSGLKKHKHPHHAALWRHALNTYAHASQIVLTFQCDHQVLKDALPSVESLYSDLAELLKVLCSHLKATLEEINYQSDPLAIATSHLETYFKGYFSTPSTDRHFSSMLFSPLSRETEISEADTPRIKRLFGMLNASADLFQIESKMSQLEMGLKEKSKQSPAHAKHFWKINHQCAHLAKIEIKQRIEMIKAHFSKIQACRSVEDTLSALNAWAKAISTLDKACESWRFQISLLGNVINGNDDEDEFIPHLDTLNLWWSGYTFISLTLKDINRLNPPGTLKAALKPEQKKSPAISSEPPPSPTASDESEEEVAAPVEAALNRPLPASSSFERQVLLLQSLKKRPLSLLNEDENPSSYLFRADKHHDLVKNSLFYLCLIEEQKNWDQHFSNGFEPLKMRLQLDHLLLLEATEKIALATLRFATEESPNDHLTFSTYNNRSIFNTHDGSTLMQYLDAAEKDLLSSELLNAPVETQEKHLKKVYWFKMSPENIPNISAIRAQCENAWKTLLEMKPSKGDQNHPLIKQAKNLRQFKSQSRQLQHMPHLADCPLKMEETAVNFKNTLNKQAAAQDYDPQCARHMQNNLLALKSLLELHDTLLSDWHFETMPLTFAVRLTEIQVSLLSLSLQLLLGKVKVPEDMTHPLLLDRKGGCDDRPLIHCHRVDQLWSVIKVHLSDALDKDESEFLTAQLRHFIGDPRYPHPTKFSLASELIQIQEKCYLIQRIDAGAFFNEKEKKLLNRHLGGNGRMLPAKEQKEILFKALALSIAQQQKKTAFAFSLADRFLNLSL